MVYYIFGRRNKPMYCKKCGKLIPDESNFCMFCGGQIREPDENNDLYPSNDIEKMYEDTMQNKVLKILKSPSTASYPKFKPEMIKSISGIFPSDSKVIETYIDSMNSFGATIRTSIRIRLTASNEFDGYALRESTSLTYSLYRH